MLSGGEVESNELEQLPAEHFRVLVGVMLVKKDVEGCKELTHAEASLAECLLQTLVQAAHPRPRTHRAKFHKPQRIPELILGHLQHTKKNIINEYQLG